MGLHPTKTRIALLDDVRADKVHRVQQQLRGGHVREWDSDDATGRRVTTALAEMAGAGWVTLPTDPPAGRMTRRWILTDAGREVLDAQATRYRIEFARIGRNHNVAPFGPIVSGPDHADQLAEEVHRYAGRYLISSACVVDVDLDAGKGWIEGGRFGTFTVTRVGVE